MSFSEKGVVDSKVVQMSLDNREFEKNAGTSISTITKLKNAFDFSEAGRGVDKLSHSMKGVNTSALASGVDVISGRFSAMEAVAFGALTNIGAKLSNIATNLVNTFAIAPVRDGFSKFELKMGSIQTIMASTGESLDTVNQYLKDLNDYSDKTIYSFSDMTQNIGKFTNAGVSLKDAVAAIKGVSNEAAISGANTNEASRAMYNFAQALSAGYVKLIDWKSIENANMATVDFKNQLLTTAEELGTVKKEADGMYQVLTTNGQGGKMKLAIDATHNFNDSLSFQWMTTEVLTKTLAKYADETTDIGKKAYAAATEVKTFSQMTNMLKEAVGTGWAQTWELVIGDFNQSKEFFTYLSGKIIGIIDAFTKSRNDFLRAAMGAPAKYVTKEDWESLELTKSQATSLAAALIELGKANGVEFTTEDVDGLVESLSQGWLTAEKLKEALNMGNTVETSKSVQNLDKLHEAALRVIRGDFGNNMNEEDENSRFNLLRKAGYDDPQAVQDYVNILKKLSGGTWELTDEIMAEADAMVTSTEAMAAKSDEELKALGWSEKRIKNLRKLQKQAEETGTPLNELVEKLENPPKSGRENLFETIKNVFSGIGKIVTWIKAAWSSIFPKADADKFRAFTEKVNSLSDSFKKFALANGMKIYKFFRGLFSVLDIGIRIAKELASALFNGLKSALSNLGIDVFGIAAKIGDLLFQFRNWIIENEIIQKGVAFLSKVVGGAIGKIKGFIDSFLNLPIVVKNVSRFKSVFSYFKDNFIPYMSEGKNRISDFIQRVKDMGGINLDNAGEVFKDFKDNVLGYFLNFPGFEKLKVAFHWLWVDIKEALGKAKESFKQFLHDFRKRIDGTVFADIYDALANAYHKIAEFFDNLKQKAKEGEGEEGEGGIFGKIKSIISSVLEYIGNIDWGKFAAIAASIAGIYGAFRLFFAVWDFLRTGKNIVKSISRTISSFAKVNEAKALETRSKAFRNFALALGIMTAAIYVLTTIDPVKMLISVGVLALLSGMLLGIMFVMSKIQKSKGMSIRTSIALISIATSVGILVGALKAMEDMSDKNIVRNLGILVGLLLAMVGVAILLSKFAPRMSRGGKGMLTLALAIEILVRVLKQIDDLELKSPIQSLGILIGLMLGLAAAVAIAKKAKLSSGLAMILAAVSILVLVSAVKSLGKLSEKKLKKGIIAVGLIGLLLGALISVTGMLSKGFATGLSNGAGMILAAAAILIVAQAVVELGSIKQKKLERGVLAVFTLGVLLAAMVTISSMLAKNPLTSLANGAAMAMAAASILIVAQAVVELGGIKENKLARGTAAVLALGVVLAAMISITGLLSGNFLSSLANGAAMAIAAAAILIAAQAVAQLGEIDADKLERGVNAVLMLGIVLAAMVSITGTMASGIFKSIGSLAGGIGMVMAAAAILIVAQAVTQLSKISKKKMVYATACISVLGLVVAAIVAVVSSVTKNYLQLFAGVVAFILVASSLMILVTAIKSLSDMDPSKMKAATACLALLMGVMTLVLVVSSIFRTIPVGLIVMTLIVGLLAVILGLMSHFKVGNALENAKALSILLLSMSASLAVLAIAGTFIAPALIGILGLIALMTVFGLLFVAMGALVDNFPSIERWISKGVPIMVKIAEGIGQILKAFLVGITDALIATMLRIPPFLKEFLQGMKEASEVGTFDFVPLLEAVGAVALVAIVGFISSILSAASEFLTGKSAVEQFGDDLVTLSEALKKWDENMEGIDGIEIPFGAIAVLAVTIAGISFMELFTSLSNAVSEFLTGKSAVEQFSSDLGTLSDALIDWKTKMEGYENVNIPTEIISELTRIIGQISFQGFFSSLQSIVNEIFNNKSNVEQFSSDLVTLSEALVTWQTNMETLDEITIPEGAIDGLIEEIGKISFAGFISSVQSILTEVFEGKSAAEQFSSDVGALATALSGWDTATKNLGTITVDSEGIQQLIDAVGLVPTQELGEVILSKFSGQSDAEKFGQDVGVLATAVKGYVQALDGVNVSDPNITASTNLISLLGTLAGTLPDQNFVSWLVGQESSMESFANALPKLGTGLSGYIDALPDTVGDNVEASTNLVALLGTLTGTLPDQNLLDWIFDKNTPLDSFSESLPKLGNGLKDYIAAIPADITSDKVTASTNLVSLLGTLAGTLPDQTFIEWLFDADTPLDKFSESLPQLGAGISAYADSLSDSITGDKVGVATNAALMLATLGNELKGQNLGSSFLFFKEKSDFEKFGGNLVELAKGLNGFVNNITSPEDLRSATMSTSRLVAAGTKLSELDLSTSDIAYEARVLMIKTNVGHLYGMLTGLSKGDYTGADSFSDALNKILAINLDEAVEKLGVSTTAGTDAGSDIASSVGKGIEANSSEVTASTSTVTNAAVNALVDSNDDFVSKGSDLIKSLAAGFGNVDAIRAVAEALRNIGNGSISVLGEYNDDFAAAGLAYIYGFAGGINNFYSMILVRGAAEAVGKAALDALKKAINSHSPSKETEKLGDYFGLGFVNHIDAFASTAYESGYGMGEYARRGLANATKAISELLSSDLEAQPVIRPVLDLSDIQTGSLAIGDMLNAHADIGLGGNLNAITANVNARNIVNNADILSALNDLGAVLSNRPVQSNSYNINGITYDDGSNVSEAVRSLIHAARIERRV